ncbi:hypothetical protein MO973_05260 [Paenibacillus sp. TRM 82003]|nr:hypothetical protein [Paenibacillus sp. TRM 82003]
MKNDANVTHQENRQNMLSGTEPALDGKGPGGRNVASVNEEVAGKEAVRSMELNTDNDRSAAT